MAPLSFRRLEPDGTADGLLAVAWAAGVAGISLIFSGGVGASRSGVRRGPGNGLLASTLTRERRRGGGSPRYFQSRQPVSTWEPRHIPAFAASRRAVEQGSGTARIGPGPTSRWPKGQCARGTRAPGKGAGRAVSGGPMASSEKGAGCSTRRGGPETGGSVPGAGSRQDTAIKGTTETEPSQFSRLAYRGQKNMRPLGRWPSKRVHGGSMYPKKSQSNLARTLERAARYVIEHGGG